MNVSQFLAPNFSGITLTYKVGNLNVSLNILLFNFETNPPWM